MRLATVLLSVVASGATAQEREPVADRIVRLMADLRIESRAMAAVDGLVELGGAAVPALATALEVLQGDTRDNQAWKEGVLTALERIGADAREAGPDLLVAAFTLPVTLAEKAFLALRAVGPAAHVRFNLESATAGPVILLNGVPIPGTVERPAATNIVRTAALTSQALRTASQELVEVQQWLGKRAAKDPRPTPDEVARWTPLLEDMTRQALVVCLRLPGLKQDSSGLEAAEALVQLQAPMIEEAEALILTKGAPEARFAAVAALTHSRIRSRHVVLALRVALHDGDLHIVREAVTAIGMAGELALPAAADLKELCTHQDPQIAARASAALRAIAH